MLYLKVIQTEQRIEVTGRLRYYSSPPTVPSFKAASRCWISTPTSCISASVCFQGLGYLANIISFPKQLSRDRVIIWQVWIGSLILINGSWWPAVQEIGEQVFGGGLYAIANSKVSWDFMKASLYYTFARLGLRRGQHLQLPIKG